ncbi:alpha/beta fold hydrolase [Chryseobacterium sp. Ch-15]|uniref:Alpha/beta fold hydrolase n=1 Tax=Chryseobacterium muglaense TaxID=2893752 RepID=A0A9Q3UTQ3_9FLAO|nr:alpha/beta fold hydrolase [Chryseobacterium muglaense]MBD3906375.1 alpha/beta fold hydrolase [Chryseobacterium muglaense]MCC9033596.1 alpha/beta fold hydrolase [Chryseobacterium muglaense]MCM2556074.1 alpha/beta fold hydrolase [Chryseobacterium muglaense]
MKKLNFTLLLFAAGFYYSQTISGTVISKNENQPVSYAKIGVDKENIGVITDENGNFTIDLSKANTSNKIKVEVAGYEPFTETVANFIKQNQQKIYLKEKVKNIQEVVLKTKKLVDKNWGVNTKTKSVMYSVNPAFRKEDFLGETALGFKASKKSKIKNINLNIASITADRPVIMRYAIYNEKNGLPNESILDEEITVELTKDKIVDGTFSLDVNDKNIWVQGKFFVGIQFLKEFEGRVNISAALFRTGYIRKFYDEWKKMTIAAPAINIDVKVDKNAKDENKFEEMNEQSIASLFPDVSKYLEESDKEIYGKNQEVGKLLTLKDANLYYEVYGEGEPLFLLHGNSGSIKDFYQQIPVLSKQYKVIVMDTRAQGKSIDKTKNELNYKIFADDVKALADHLGLQKINIAGWSDGGNTGLEFALKYPQNLGKLITIGANAVPEGVDKELINNFSIKYKVLQLQNKPEKLNERRLLKLMLKEPNISEKQLNKIQNKVLVIAGEKDVITQTHTEFMAKQIPNSELKIYKDATHMIPFENADQLNQDILEFLKQ